jgi:uncharacterized protein YlxW (UPF0749 family)
MASGNHLRERVARLESQVEQARKELESLHRAKHQADRLLQHMRAVLIVVAAISLQHAGPVAKLVLGLLR